MSPLTVLVVAGAVLLVAATVWMVKANPRPPYQDSDDDHMYVGW